jgi:hypothetical protein
MEFDRLPSKPVIKSLTSAQAEWDSWLSQNNVEFLRDGDGLDWRLVMRFNQLPSEVDRHKGKWVATVQLGIDLPITKLIETGTLDPEHDSRLIGLAGNGMIPLRMKKLQYEAVGEADMRDTIARVIPELRENFRKTSLHDVKRDLLGRWIDSLAAFGSREEHGIEGGALQDIDDNI